MQIFLTEAFTFMTRNYDWDTTVNPYLPRILGWAGLLLFA